jgi:hypothetical protein
MICDVVRVRDGRWFAVLYASGAIKVEAVQPDPSAVEQLPSMLFVEWLCRVGEVKV